MIFKIKSQHFATTQMVCHMMSWEQYHQLRHIAHSSLTHNIIRETIEVEKKRWIKILAHSRVNGALRRWIVLLGNSWSSCTKKWLIKRKHLTINTIKLNFVQKTSSMLYHIKSYRPSNTRGVEHYRNPISLYRQKISSRIR